MTNIIPRLYVGIMDDFKEAKNIGFSILGACKEPLHRANARLRYCSYDGYLGRAMPKDEPEYLMARREHALYLNLIDARDAKFIPDEIISAAISFIEEEIEQNRNVIIICNKAESRSPSIALMYIIKHGFYTNFNCFEDVIISFKTLIYPDYNPSNGMRMYVEKFWEKNKNKLEAN